MNISSRENYSSIVSDAILISNLELALRIGTTASERSAPQKIALDLELFLCLRQAGKSNDLSQTIDYSLVAQQLEDQLAKQEWVLLENLAETLCTILFDAHPHLSAIGVEVRKFVIPRTASVGIKIWRQR